MKLPKFIKNSTHQERQQNLLKSNRQLQLTEFKFQPQKSALFKDILNDNPKTPSTPLADLYQIKSSNKLINESMNQFSASLNCQTGRYVKSSQPKRLQRNRLIQSKAFNTNTNTNTNTMSNFSFKVNSTPNNTSEIINSNGRKLNEEYNLDAFQLESPCTPKINEKSETCVKKNQEQQTPNSARFSLSKLTKFVSRSALKVISSRKSIGTPDSSCSNSCSTSSMSTDDDLEDKENSPVCAKPLYNSNIYSSLEQQKEIEEKINKLYMKPVKNVNQIQKQPSMGITSCMLNNIKKKCSNQYGLTTGICGLPNSYLIGVPIVFKSENLQQQSKPKTVLQEQNYDRLNHEQKVPFLSENLNLNLKKITKPIVKSLSSIQNAGFSNDLFSKTKSTKLSTVNLSPSLPNNSCRISIFSSKNSSTSKLEKQLHYESFSEAVF